MSRKRIKKVRVSVVEDLPGHLALLRRRLVRMGDVAIVGLHPNGEEALDIIPNTRPHLVLMDILLPNLNGVECTRRLKALIPSLKIVMVTSVHDRQALKEALLAGAEGYVTKPVDREDLADAIHSVLMGQAFVSRSMLNDLCDLARGRPSGNPDPRLTSRENEVLDLLRNGSSAKAAGELLGISTATVKKHLQNTYWKLGAHNRVEALNSSPTLYQQDGLLPSANSQP